MLSVEDRSVTPGIISGRARRTRWRIDPYWGLVAPILLLLSLMYLLPLANVFLLSVTDPSPGLSNYERVLTQPGPVRVLTNTLRISAITTAIAVVLGYCVALAMAHAGRVQRRFLLIGVLIPLWISVLIRAFSWLVLLRDNGPLNQWLLQLGVISGPIAFVRNELGVVIGMVHYLLPFAILPIYSVMQGIDERLIFASRSLGARAATTFLRVYFPLTLPGVLASTIVVFVFGLGFYVTPAIVGGGRVVMMSEAVSVSILTTARWGLGSAQSVVLFVLILALMIVLSRTAGLKKGFR